MKHYDAGEKIMPPKLLEASSRRCPCAERKMNLDLKFISQKKFQKTFVGFDLDYVMSYLEAVTLRYHHLKAEHLINGVKKAELAMLSEAPASKIANENDKISLKECEPSDVKMAATENSATPKCASKPKKRPTDSAFKEGKKKKISSRGEWCLWWQF